jgi:signal transduction histidine kinase
MAKRLFAMLPRIPFLTYEEEDLAKSIGLGVLAISSLAVLIMTVVAFINDQKRAVQELEKSGTTLLGIMEKAARDPLEMNDHRRLEEIFGAVNEQNNLVYYMILDKGNKVLLHSDKSKQGLISPDTLAVEAHKTQQTRWRIDQDSGSGVTTYDFATPIRGRDGSLGILRIGLKMDDQKTFFVKHYLRDIYKGALIIFSLTFLFYYLMRHRFRPLKRFRVDPQVLLKDSKTLTLQVPEVGSTFGEVSQLFENYKLAVNSLNTIFQRVLDEKAELELRLNFLTYERKSLQLAFDCLPDAIILTNTSGELALMNNSAVNLLNTSKSEALSRPLREIIKEERILSLLEEQQGREPRVVHELTIPSGDKTTERAFKIFYDVLMNGKGKVSGKIMIFKDITQQRLADEMRHKFVSEVSHELRTPLTSIKSHVELLMDGDVQDRDKQVEFLNHVNTEVDRLSNLIENLLNISKIELGSVVLNRAPVNIKKLLEESLTTIESQASKKHIALEVNIPDRLSSILELDKSLMSMVINNLLGNAVKYTPEGGRIWLEGEEGEAEVYIHVRDTGVGISEEELPHIFEKFYRSHRREVRDRPGHGLGLSLAQQIAKLHGGMIRIESKVGEGSRFTLALPKTRNQNVKPAGVKG